MSNNNIQLIERQPIIVRINNANFEFVKPYYLYDKQNFIMHKAVLKGSQLAWNINGCQLTYHQLKNKLLS